MTRRLTAHRTFALQATLTRCPEVALLALTQQLVLETFFSLSYGVRQLVQIRADEPSLESYGSDLKGCKAQVALDQQGDAWRQLLPKEPQRLFAWLLERPAEERMRLFAYCVARTVNGVSAEEKGSVMDEVAKAAGLDMREWFSPTAENYFGSVPKARILEAVREAISPEVAVALAGMKKRALSQEAEKRLAGTGWLPRVLRGQAA